MARAQVVLLNGDNILLARHERGGRAFWVLPGGAVEDGETPEQAAIREVREETGLEIELVRLLFIDGPGERGGVTILRPRHTYLGRVTGGTLAMVEEPDGGDRGHLTGAAWMAFDSPSFDAATRDTLDRVASSLAVYPSNAS